MMKSRDRYAVAVRKEDGSISVKTDHCASVRKKYKILNLPILRGVVNFVEMMLLSPALPSRDCRRCFTPPSAILSPV